MKTFDHPGLELAYHVERRGWDRRSFAAHIEVSAKTVNRWFWNRAPIPRVVLLYAKRGLPYATREAEAAVRQGKA